MLTFSKCTISVLHDPTCYQNICWNAKINLWKLEQKDYWVLQKSQTLYICTNFVLLQGTSSNYCWCCAMKACGGICKCIHVHICTFYMSSTTEFDEHKIHRLITAGFQNFCNLSSFYHLYVGWESQCLFCQTQCSTGFQSLRKPNSNLHGSSLSLYCLIDFNCSLKTWTE